MSGPDRVNPASKPVGPSKLGLPMAAPKPTLPGLTAPTAPKAPTGPIDGKTLAGNDRAAAVALAETQAVKPPAPDDGKTWGDPSSKRDLNFGHEPNEKGDLFEVAPGGQIVWADGGKALTPDQWANMPAAQQAKIAARLPADKREAFEAKMATGDAAEAHVTPRKAGMATPGEGNLTAGDPARYFISQYRSDSNPNEDVRNNGNCGPTSLLMCAKAFGKANPTPAQVDAAIEDVRTRGGATSEQRAGHGSAASFPQLAKAARSYGLEAHMTGDGGVKDVQAQLAQGRLVVALVKPGFYTPSGSSGHYVTVTKIQDGKVYLNDPMKKGGPIVVAAADFGKALEAKGGRFMAVGEP